MTNQQETKMNINDLTIGQARELAGMLGGAQPSHRFKVGTAYLVQTVTHYFTGVITWVGATEIALADCAWIADTGRFADALAKASFDEVEPFPPGEVIIGRGAIVAASELTGSAPRVQK